jgi:hypothetical protein
MFNEIKNDKNFIDWKIVIIQPIINERGAQNPKSAQKFLLLLICDKIFPEILAGRLSNWLSNNRILSMF